MTRAQKVAWLVAHVQDGVREGDLNAIDEQARTSRTWGSPAHREARDRRERIYDAACAAYAAMSDAALDEALAVAQARS
jgi:hypothetical protein